MNVTLSLFPNTAADAPPGLASAPGTAAESVPGQAVAPSNPFAMLLSGQLQGGPDGSGRQPLLVALGNGKLPAALAAQLPQTGKPLPTDAQGLPAAAQASDGDGTATAGDAALLPLQLAAVLQSVVPNPADGTKPPVQFNAGEEGADGALTLNIMKLALGDVLSEKQPNTATQQGGDDPLLARIIHAGVVRADGDRAAALLQPNAQHLQASHGEPRDQASGTTGAATPLTGDALRAPADVQARAAPAAAAQATLQQPLGKNGWDQDLGSRLVWMSKQNLDSAQLRLNPAHLGPLEVRLSIQHDQTANVTFLSNHAPVRDAVEAALPRLREMLADSGVNLTDANVSSHSHGQAREQANAGGWFGQGADDLDAASAEEVARAVSIGLVDYFA